MVSLGAISLLVDDPSVLAALEFSLSIEGFQIRQAPDENNLAGACGALVIDERYLGDGVLSVERLRDRGWTAPAIILATNPTVQLRKRAVAAHAIVVEKPLLGDELSGALRNALRTIGN